MAESETLRRPKHAAKSLSPIDGSTVLRLPLRPHTLLGRLLRQRSSLVALCVLGFVVLACLSYSALAWVFRGSFNLSATTTTSNVLLRTLRAGLNTMLVAATAVMLAGIAGTLLGTAAARRGNWAARALTTMSRMGTSVPVLALLLTALAFVPASLPRSIWTVSIVLAIVLVVPLACCVRDAVAECNDRPFIHGARAAGVSETRILARHVMPNVSGIIVSSMLAAAATAIMTESTLSFLGFGATASTPTWGTMLRQAEVAANLRTAAAWAPAAALTLTTLALAILWHGLRETCSARAAEEAAR